jgi:hypothetical protein
MPAIDLTDEEWQQVVNIIINANPLVTKIIQQLQAQHRAENMPPDRKGNGPTESIISSK